FYHAVPARPFFLVLATSARQTGSRPAFLFSSGCPCANVERTPGATYMSATGKVGALHGRPHAAPRALAPAALACMGVVLGDIGTSPLYTVSVTLKASSSGGTVAPEAVLRDRVTDLLVAGRRHLHQIRAAHHARRQPRRGRHPCPAGADQSAARQA